MKQTSTKKFIWTGIIFIALIGGFYPQMNNKAVYHAVAQSKVISNSNSIQEQVGWDELSELQNLTNPVGVNSSVSQQSIATPISSSNREVIFVIDSSTSVNGCDQGNKRFLITKLLMTLLKYQAPEVNIQLYHLTEKKYLNVPNPLQDARPQKPTPAKYFSRQLWTDTFKLDWFGAWLRDDYSMTHLVAEQFDPPIMENKKGRIVFLIGDGNFSGGKQGNSDHYQELAEHKLNALDPQRQVKIYPIFVCKNTNNWWDGSNFDGLTRLDGTGPDDLSKSINEIINFLVSEKVLPSPKETSWHWDWLSKNQSSAEIKFPLTTKNILIRAATVRDDHRVGMQLMDDNGEGIYLENSEPMMDSLGNVGGVPKDQYFDGQYLVETPIRSVQPLPDCLDHVWELGFKDKEIIDDQDLYFYWWQGWSQDFNIEFDNPVPRVQIDCTAKEFEFRVDTKISLNGLRDPDWNKLGRCYNVDISDTEFNQRDSKPVLAHNSFIFSFPELLRKKPINNHLVFDISVMNRISGERVSQPKSWAVDVDYLPIFEPVIHKGKYIYEFPIDCVGKEFSTWEEGEKASPPWQLSIDFPNGCHFPSIIPLYDPDNFKFEENNKCNLNGIVSDQQLTLTLGLNDFQNTCNKFTVALNPLNSQTDQGNFQFNCSYITDKTDKNKGEITCYDNRLKVR